MKSSLYVCLVLTLLPPLASGQARKPLNVNHGSPQLTCRDMLRNAPPLPHVLAAIRMCERSDAETARQLARIYGRPVPSDHVIELPAHGTEFARKLGYACMGGLAMKRLKNGWEQVRDSQYRYARCREIY